MSGDSLLIILVVGVVAAGSRARFCAALASASSPISASALSARSFGNWILPKLGIHLGAHLLPQIISATIGAIVLLLILGLVQTALLN